MNTIEFQQNRAATINQIREFFAQKNVLEVETPLLCPATVTDPYIESISATILDDTFYLQTSPEYAMKKLLADGSGSIFQICKAFRNEESGKIHNPEFTMLEWYRVGFDHHQLMDEMDELLQLILQCQPAQRITYQQLFLTHFDIDPHTTDIETLKNLAIDHNINLTDPESIDRDTWLNLLITHVIEPTMGIEQPLFLYDYPASQAALAKMRDGNPPVAERFEVYVNGVELANGFHELTDAKEQAARFEKDLAQRQQLGLSSPKPDKTFLAALEKGLPECAGVALGIDRLIMLALSVDNIHLAS